MQRRHLLAVSLAASTALLGAPDAVLAQSGVAGSNGNRPIRLIVPYAPGGPLDTTARALAERVRDTLGPVIVDNKPGAGGNIGADAVAKAAPDGLTIGIAATATHAVNPWLYRRMPFDAARDFAGITQMVRVPNVLVMNADKAKSLNINTLADLIAYAKKQPAELNYGSGGNGSAGHLAGEMFKQRAGIYALHIPYRGASPAQLALLAGEVDFNIDNLAAAAPNIRAGKTKALAVTTLEASPMLPGVPPLSNTFKGFGIDTWWGLVAPAGTPIWASVFMNLLAIQPAMPPMTIQPMNPRLPGMWFSLCREAEGRRGSLGDGPLSPGPYPSEHPLMPPGANRPPTPRARPRAPRRDRSVRWRGRWGRRRARRPARGRCSRARTRRAAPPP